MGREHMCIAPFFPNNRMEMVNSLGDMFQMLELDGIKGL
jgi:hypothetical protein